MSSEAKKTCRCLTHARRAVQTQRRSLIYRHLAVQELWPGLRIVVWQVQQQFLLNVVLGQAMEQKSQVITAFSLEMGPPRLCLVGLPFLVTRSMTRLLLDRFSTGPRGVHKISCCPLAHLPQKHMCPPYLLDTRTHLPVLRRRGHMNIERCNRRDDRTNNEIKPRVK